MPYNDYTQSDTDRLYYFEILTDPRNQHPVRYVGRYAGPPGRMTSAMDDFALHLKRTRMSLLRNVQLIQPMPSKIPKPGLGSFESDPLILTDARRALDNLDDHADPRLLRAIDDMVINKYGFPENATLINPQEVVIIGTYRQPGGRGAYVTHPRSYWDALEYVKAVDGEKFNRKKPEENV